RQHGQKRKRHDRARRVNPSKRDTSTSAVTRHHRCSSMQQGSMRNISHEAYGIETCATRGSASGLVPPRPVQATAAVPRIESFATKSDAEFLAALAALIMLRR